MNNPFYDRFGKVHYPNDGEAFPRSAIYGIIIKSGQVLLTTLPRFEWFEFPGGGINRGEELREALSRELYEESGYEIDWGNNCETIHQQVNFFADDIRPSGEYWLYDQTYLVCDGDKYGVELRDGVWRTPENGQAKWVKLDAIKDGSQPINYFHKMAFEKLKL